ncbi:MAG TPA: hypothetical protein VFS67_32180 [Polyangiaceae bacterium]|jgi:hypothetical protein|nr:hypothetical protein [Polyangiaceae bacterium]
MEFIDNWFPLIVTVREGSFDEAEMEQMATGWERYFRRAEPYAVLNTARLGANAPDARGRLRIAQWGNQPRVRQFAKLLCAGSATVMTFPWERRAATALSWLWTPPSPCRSVSSVDEGLAYCLGALAERGVDLPRDPETFRIDVQRMLRGLSIAGLPPRRESRPLGWVSRPSARTDSVWHPSRTAPLQRASTSQAGLTRARPRNSRST